MRIAVSSRGPDLASVVDALFGRAAHFIVYDTDSESFYTLNNADNAGAAQGAGIQAAQLLAQRSVDVVVSGNMGPKAFETLRAVGIQMIAWDKGTVSEAIELVRTGQLQPLDSANARGQWR